MVFYFLLDLANLILNWLRCCLWLRRPFCISFRCSLVKIFLYIILFNLGANFHILYFWVVIRLLNLVFPFLVGIDLLVLWFFRRLLFIFTFPLILQVLVYMRFSFRAILKLPMLLVLHVAYHLIELLILIWVMTI